MRPSGARLRVPPVLAAALVGAALLGGFFAGARLSSPPDLEAWRGDLARVGRARGVDPALLAAMVAVESGGRADATSPRGARGLLQLLPGTALEEARRIGLSEEEAGRWEAPAVNLDLGAAYLARLLARYDGEEAFALAAYNAGPTAVDRWRARAPTLSSLGVVMAEGYAETRRHVAKVLAWRAHYRALGY